MSDKFIDLLATLRVWEKKLATRALFSGRNNSCYDWIKKHEKLGNIHYFHGKADQQPVEKVSLCVLHKNCIKRFGVKEDRVWPLADGSFDVHLATSAFVMGSIVNGNPEHFATRVEPSELDKVYGTTLAPNVPWIVKPHLGRKACVFRVYVGVEPAEVTDALKTMRENEKVGSLLETGEFGLMILAPSQHARDEMEDAIKHHMKDTRIFVGVGPTADTLLKYLERK